MANGHSPVSPSKSTGRHFYLLLALLILLGSATIRIVRLDDTPLYLDEATHVMRAEQVVTQGDIYAGIVADKALFPMVLAIFKPLGPEGPFLGRMISVWAGLIGVAGCIALGKSLGSTRVGLLAGLICAMLPVTVFHERQVLVDPLKAAFTTLCILLIVWMAKKPRVWQGVLLGAALAGAYLTKISSLFFFVLPLIGIPMLSRQKSKLWRALAISVGAIALGALISYEVYQMAARDGVEPVQEHTSTTRIRLLTWNEDETQEALKRDLGNMADFTRAYIGWPMLGLSALSLAWIVLDKKRWELLYLWVPAGAFTVGLLLIQTDLWTLPARYFQSSFAPLIVLAVIALDTGIEIITDWQPQFAPWVLGLLVGIITIPALGIDWAIIHDIDTAPLAKGDRDLYVVGLTAGHAYKEAAEDLLAIWEAGDGRPLNTMTYEGFYWQTTVHLVLQPQIRWRKPSSGRTSKTAAIMSSFC
ncbi:MAG: glycosyltransferase family 39 protein, partial [Anaerolineae bacterium]|nr:glycosyltransferase family 39 protein [Anaerolineae bacterium]